MQNTQNEIKNAAALFLVGAGIGAVTALLFAPKAGSELRTDIADATKRGLDQARDTGRQVSERASEVYQTGVERANELAERAKHSVNSLAERGSEILQRQSHQIAAAVEAGKGGYEDAKRADQLKSLTATTF